MPALQIRVRGADRVKRALASLQPPQRQKAERVALLASGKHLQREVRAYELSGRLLRRRTGELADSILLDRSGITSRRPELSVGSALEQAAPLHWGWPGKNIRPRPYMEHAASREQVKFIGFWVGALEQQVARGARAGL